LQDRKGVGEDGGKIIRTAVSEFKGYTGQYTREDIEKQIAQAKQKGLVSEPTLHSELVVAQDKIKSYLGLLKKSGILRGPPVKVNEIRIIQTDKITFGAYLVNEEGKYVLYIQAPYLADTEISLERILIHEIAEFKDLPHQSAARLELSPEALASFDSWIKQGLFSTPVWLYSIKYPAKKIEIKAPLLSPEARLEQAYGKFEKFIANSDIKQYLDLENNPGFTAAIMLSILAKLYNGEPEDQVKEYIINELIPALFSAESQHYFLGEVGTEIEIRQEYAGGYPLSKIKEIWEKLGLSLGNDELVEFALPPTLSFFTQLIMISSMEELGFVPEGWFSMHISSLVPEQFYNVRLLKTIASYFELVKLILYTSDGRIKRFTQERWSFLMLKGRNIVPIDGKKKKSKKIASKFEKDLKTRLEYRSGEANTEKGKEAEADNKFYHSHEAAIKLVQYLHGLLLLALAAALDIKKVDSAFEAMLLEEFDRLVRDLEEFFKAKIYPRVGLSQPVDLVSKGYFSEQGIPEKLSLIASIRDEKLRNELNTIITKFLARMEGAFAAREELEALPPDYDAINNLELIKRLREEISALEEKDKEKLRKFDFMSIPPSLLFSLANFTPAGGASINNNARTDILNSFRRMPVNIELNTVSVFTPPQIEPLKLKIDLAALKKNWEESFANNFVLFQPQGNSENVLQRAGRYLIRSYNNFITHLSQYRAWRVYMNALRRVKKNLIEAYNVLITRLREDRDFRENVILITILSAVTIVKFIQIYSVYGVDTFDYLLNSPLSRPIDPVDNLMRIINSLKNNHLFNIFGLVSFTSFTSKTHDNKEKRDGGKINLPEEMQKVEEANKEGKPYQLEALKEIYESLSSMKVSESVKWRLLLSKQNDLYREAIGRATNKGERDSLETIKFFRDMYFLEREEINKWDAISGGQISFCKELVREANKKKEAYRIELIRVVQQSLPYLGEIERKAWEILLANQNAIYYETILEATLSGKAYSLEDIRFFKKMASFKKDEAAKWGVIEIKQKALHYKEGVREANQKKELYLLKFLKEIYESLSDLDEKERGEWEVLLKGQNELYFAAAREATNRGEKYSLDDIKFLREMDFLEEVKVSEWQKIKYRQEALQNRDGFIRANKMFELYAIDSIKGMYQLLPYLEGEERSELESLLSGQIALYKEQLMGAGENIQLYPLVDIIKILELLPFINEKERRELESLLKKQIVFYVNHKKAIKTANKDRKLYPLKILSKIKDYLKSFKTENGWGVWKDLFARQDALYLEVMAYKERRTSFFAISPKGKLLEKTSLDIATYATLKEISLAILTSIIQKPTSIEEAKASLDIYMQLYMLVEGKGEYFKSLQDLFLIRVKEGAFLKDIHHEIVAKELYRNKETMSQLHTQIGDVIGSAKKWPQFLGRKDTGSYEERFIKIKQIAQEFHTGSFIDQMLEKHWEIFAASTKEEKLKKLNELGESKEQTLYYESLVKSLVKRAYFNSEGFEKMESALRLYVDNIYCESKAFFNIQKTNMEKAVEKEELIQLFTDIVYFENQDLLDTHRENLIETIKEVRAECLDGGAVAKVIKISKQVMQIIFGFLTTVSGASALSDTPVTAGLTANKLGEIMLAIVLVIMLAAYITVLLLERKFKKLEAEIETKIKENGKWSLYSTETKESPFNLKNNTYFSLYKNRISNMPPFRVEDGNNLLFILVFDQFIRQHNDIDDTPGEALGWLEWLNVNERLKTEQAGIVNELFRMFEGDFSVPKDLFEELAKATDLDRYHEYQKLIKEELKTDVLQKHDMRFIMGSLAIMLSYQRIDITDATPITIPIIVSQDLNFECKTIFKAILKHL